MKPTEKKLGAKDHRRQSIQNPKHRHEDDIREGTLPDPESEDEVVADPEGAKQHGNTSAA